MQLGITLRYLCFVIVSAFLSGLAVYITLWPVIESFVPYELLGPLRTRLLIKLLCYGIPLIVLMIGVCIVMTHRIAGPLYNIEQKLERLALGEDVRYIQIRRHDEFKGLVAKLNQLILKLRDKDVQKG